MSRWVHLTAGTGGRVWRRGIATEWLLVLALAAAVLLATASLAAMPRIFEHASVSDVRHTVATAAPERRNIALSLHTRIGPNPSDPFAAIDARGERLQNNVLPEELGDVVVGRVFVVDSPPFRVTSYPERLQGPFPTTFRFRMQQGIEAESELVEGEQPAPHDPIRELAGVECPEDATPETYEPVDDVECEVIDVPVLETAITRETAENMDVRVGDMVTLTPNQNDLRWQVSGQGELRVVLRISGLVELSDVARPYWYADNRLHDARITENSDQRLVDATGLISDELYPQLYADIPQVDFDHTWRLFVDPDRIDLERADALAIELANVELDPVVVTTGLPSLIREFRQQRTIVLVLLSTVVVGLAVVVAAAVSAVALLLAMRQAPATQLVVARGATRRQLLGDALRTAVVVVVPPVATGALVAWSLFRSTTSGAATRVALVFGLAVAATVVVALRVSRDRSRRSIRRTVVEITLVVAAAAAAFTVRRSGDASVDGVAEVDALLAITPSLIVAAASVMLVRLVTPVGRALAWLAERGDGLSAFVGFRQLVARPTAARTATGVTAVAIGVAIFATSVDASINTAREASSWYEVGADATVSAQNFGTPLSAAVDSFVDVTTAERATFQRSLIRFGRDGSEADVVAIDATAYREMLADAPIEHPPLDLLTASPSTTAALISTHWQRGRRPEVGDEISFDLGAGQMTVTVAATIDTFPAVAAGRPFVVVDLDTADVDGTIRPTSLHFGDLSELGQRIADEVPRVRVVARRDVVDTLATDPLASWTVRVLRFVAILAAVFAAATASTALAISVLVRSRDLAMLHTLGLDVRQGSAMTVFEHLPSLLMAAVGGTVSGAASAWLLRTALGLARFAGPGRPVEVRLDAGATLTMAGLVVLAMVLAVALSIRIQRRHDLAATLRVGDMT